MVARNKRDLEARDHSLRERTLLAKSLFTKPVGRSNKFRVISVLSHQHQIFDQTFRRSLQQEIVREGKEPVFALRIFSRKGGVRISWHESLEARVLEDHYVDLSTQEYGEFADRFYSLLAHVKKSYQCVLIFIEDSEQRELIGDCLHSSEKIYLSFTDQLESIESVKKTHNFARFSLLKKESSLLPVFIDQGEHGATTHSRVRKNLNLPIRIVYRLDSSCRGSLCSDLTGDTISQRLSGQLGSWARDICQTRTGVVFSSGCAKGLAHIGAIQVLEQNHIPVDAVVGCSMGSVIGALWASGYNGQQLERISKELSVKHPLWQLVDPVFPPRRGVIRGNKIRAILERYIGDARFSDTSIPLSIVATHLPSLDRKVFTEGQIVPAIMASSAMPGIVEPILHQGEQYVDGGVVDPLPTQVLKEQNINRIIAVSVIPSPDDVKECSFFFENFPKPHRPIRHWLNKHLNYFYKDNVFDIVMRSFEASTIRVAQEDAKVADVVIRAVRCQDTWHDFGHPEKFIRLGKNAARNQLSAIQSLVTK